MEARLATCPECGFTIPLQDQPAQDEGGAMAFLALCTHQSEGPVGHCPVFQGVIDRERAAGQART